MAGGVSGKWRVERVESGGWSEWKVAGGVRRAEWKVAGGVRRAEWKVAGGVSGKWRVERAD